MSIWKIFYGAEIVLGVYKKTSSVNIYRGNPQEQSLKFDLDVSRWLAIPLRVPQFDAWVNPPNLPPLLFIAVHQNGYVPWQY